jgi:hypothetical protein
MTIGYSVTSRICAWKRFILFGSIDIWAIDTRPPAALERALT